VQNAPSAAQTLAEVERSLSRYPRVVLCHILRCQGSTPGKIGWKLLVHPDDTTYGNLGGGAFEALVGRDARALLQRRDAEPEIRRYYLTEDAVRGTPTGMVCGGFSEVFLEVLKAEPLLLICGGGPVAQALATQASHLGLGLAIAEDRPPFRRAGLFPEGAALIAVDRDYAGDFLKPFLDRDLFVAVVTRCWETDVAALAGVLRQSPRHLQYVGLMGSRRKVERVRAELERRGHDLDSSRLHAPIGLPIGGDTPAEIAVSILAEIVQVRHQSASADVATEREAAHARDRT
jgi:xanthine dehydrogenase accessory factor